MKSSLASTRLLFSSLALLVGGSEAPAAAAESSPAAQEAAAEAGAAIYYHHPRWSPAGNRIAFYSHREGNFEIYTVRPDGSDLQRLTRNESNDTEECWSPDGAHLVFSSNRDGNPGLYRMNADGTHLRIFAGRAQAAAWSSDGEKIAYEGRVGDNRDIFVMNADGSAVTRLTLHEANDFRPAWSPDGSKIVFVTDNADRPGLSLFTMNADGSQRRLLMPPRQD